MSDFIQNLLFRFLTSVSTLWQAVDLHCLKALIETMEPFGGFVARPPGDSGARCGLPKGGSDGCMGALSTWSPG